MAHHVIYLPGLSDHTNGHIQKKALVKWRKHNFEPHFVHINWHDNESFKHKFERILKLIDGFIDNKNTVSLVAASAGCSMAINVYAARKDKIASVVLICGKLRDPGTVGENYKTQNPSFIYSVIESDKIVKKLDKTDKVKMLTLRPLFDETVKKSDGTIEGVSDKIFLSVEHALSIILALSLYKRVIINFIKSKSVQ
jgi:hypothetical protein